MIYFLGIDERYETILQSGEIEFVGKCWQRINIYPLLSELHSDTTAVEALKSSLSNITSTLTADTQIVTSNEPINSDIRVALRRGYRFSVPIYERINTLITQFIIFFMNVSVNKIEYSPLIDESALYAEKRNCIYPTLNKLEPKLYSRYGNVELRVIENWLTRHALLEQAAKNIAEKIDDEQYMYSDGLRKHWLSSEDSEFNLRILMTNAGFYEAQYNHGSLNLWCGEYYNAIKSSSYLFPYPGAYPNFFITQDMIFEKTGKIIDYINFPNTELFYQLLAGQDILFVTPFAKAIEQNFVSGNIYKLYKNIEIPEFTLRTIPAPISTYPNRPNSSWGESYEMLKEDLRKTYNERPYTLFIASAGCYGLPICGFAYNEFGCASLYYGNAMNTLFGIRQECSESWIRDQRNLEYWVRSELGSIRNMDRIDNGRYIARK